MADEKNLEQKIEAKKKDKDKEKDKAQSIDLWMSNLGGDSAPPPKDK